jgi:sugar (pentulose or hexulose) kinase
MSAIAVLDVGKTNVKAALFSREGLLLSEESAPNAPLPGPPYRVCDADGAFAFALRAFEGMQRLRPIEAIVVTTHGAALALVDEAGLVLPVLDYEERAVDAVEPLYAPLRPPFAETASPPMTGALNAGRGLFFLKTRFPEAFARARRLLMYPQYFTWRLTGVAVGEVTSLACHTDLWSPAGGRPSSLVDRMGVAALLPPMASAFDAVGPLLPDIASRTGIGVGARVLAGIHDSNASLLLQLPEREPPFTVVSTGTWTILLHVGGDLARLDPAADMLANVDAAGRPVACARFMGGREYAALTAGSTAPPTIEAARALIARGAMALPAFSDQGGAYASRRGEVVGAVEPAERASLASLYLALLTDDQLTRLGARGPILVDGNAAANPVYLGALAGLRSGQRVLAAGDAAGAARGAAALAVWPRVFGTRSETTIEPDALPAEALYGYAERWRAAIAGGV